MNRFARIEKGVVVELFVNSTGRTMQQLFPPSMLWVECADSNVREGWGYHGTSQQFSAPEDPVVDIDKFKSEKLNRINDAKNTYLDGGFMHNGTLYDSDIKARLAYLEVEKKLRETPGYSTDWKASRGQWVTMDAALFASLQATYEAHIQACFAWQAEREQELAAAYAAGDRAAMEAVAETM